MRILQVVHGYPMRYNAGSEIYTQTLCRGLTLQGHTVCVFTREEDPFNPDYVITEKQDTFRSSSNTERKIMLKIVNVARQKDRYQSDGVDKCFNEVLNAFNPDIIHFQHLNHLSLGLITCAANINVPIVFTLHDYWLACPRGQFLQINYGMEEPWKICNEQDDRRCAEHCYSRYYTGISSNSVIDMDYWINWVGTRQKTIKSFLQLIDLFIAPSYHIMNRMKTELSIPTNKIKYLDYGFDLTRLSRRNRVNDDKTVFGYIGTHIVSKGIHQLIHAFSLVKEPAILRIWGRPRNETTPYLKSYIKSITLPSHLSIEWRSEFQNSDIVYEVFNHTDAIVIPSIWDENSPLVIHEALQARVPVITANHGGMSEYIHHLENGLLFNHRDSYSLGNQMNYYISNKAEVNLLAQRGYLQSKDGNIISIEDHVDQIITEYTRLKESE